MSFKPLRIRARLRTSIRLGRFPVSLDGLLWHCLFLQSNDPDGATERLGLYLDERDGVFKASTLCFGVYQDSQLVATTTPTVGTMRSGSDLSPEQFHPTGKNGRYTKIQVEGGLKRSRINNYDTYYAPELTWDAVGDGDAICRLLNFYVLAVGLEANRGFGAIASFTWEPLDEDTSWFDSKGQPVRLLPIGIAPKHKGPTVNAQVKPPYRNGADEPCLVPERIRRIQLTPTHQEVAP